MPRSLFVPEDLLTYRLVTDVQLSPDGSEVLYCVQECHEAGDGYRSAIWLVPWAGGEPRRLTSGEFSDSRPRWSPDGSRIAFVSDRADGARQIFVLPRDGGDARQLTHGNGAAAHNWSPDGTRLVFTSVVDVEQAPDEDSAAKARFDNRPRVVREPYFRMDGLGYSLESRTHLYTVSADGTGERALTHGLANETSPTWSPDGRRLAFVRSRAGAESYLSDIWTCAADGGDERRITRTAVAPGSPSWSPDGRWIAFTASRVAGQAIAKPWIVPAAGGLERELAGEADADVASLTLASPMPAAWSEDGRAIVFLAAWHGRHQLARIALDGEGEPAPLTVGDRQIALASVSSDGRRAAFAAMDFATAGEVFAFDLAAGRERQLTHLNDAWSSVRGWPRVEARTFESPHGGTIDGWLLLPPGDRPRPWPVLVDVHGGPQSDAQFGYPYHPYRHVLSARGWAVLVLNPHGSASYGYAFAESIRGRWGEYDFPETLAAIDQLAAAGDIDPARAAIAGKSYGGYLAAWAIGHSNRFRAAVIGAPVANLESHFATSDSGFYVDPYDMGCEPWEDPERWRRLSPASCIAASRTPALFLQGEADGRCPPGQSAELYQRMQRRGIAATELVLYPGGDHHVLESGPPSQRVDYVRRLVEWVERWTCE